MDDAFKISPLSKESIYTKLDRVDKALSKLNNSNASDLVSGLSKDDLFDIFTEARERLLAQLNTLEETETTEEASHEFLEYPYQIEALRNRVGRNM